MTITSPINIGWKQSSKDYTLTQGNTGQIIHKVVALRDDGTPYTSYIGFTAKVSFFTLGGKKVLDILSDDITISHNPSTNELTFTIEFKTEDTYLLPAQEKLVGDLMVIAPDGIEKQYPLIIKLWVNQSFSR